MPTDIATRAMVVALMAPTGGAKTTVEIHALTGLPIQTIRNIYARAIRRGFEPNERPVRLINAWLEDTPRPTNRLQETGHLVITKAMMDSHGSGRATANVVNKPPEIAGIVKNQPTTRKDSTSPVSDWVDEEE
ncbi:hypothetical protein FBEOM_6546 [Fusarium beomiforme]|uniref:Uncharacterized protein n=1 Tax=Fusarium beomiforme TaxID=44412 RepID=A0A9P5DW18_9HYPO|nr:hypothetical protein FBEOM_6546 [Fusarium beomiforme]